MHDDVYIIYIVTTAIVSRGWRSVYQAHDFFVVEKQKLPNLEELPLWDEVVADGSVGSSR